MARYSSLLGTGIEVVYRYCGMDLRPSGELLADSGTYIIVEEHLDQDGSSGVYPLRLPYACIIRIERK